MPHRIVLILLALLVLPPSRTLAGGGGVSHAPAPGPGCGVDEDVPRRPPGSARTLASACPARGPCDDPATRDATGTHWLNLRAIVHVFRRSDGSGGTTQAMVDATLAQMNHDFRANGSGVQIDLAATRFHDTDVYYCLPPCEALHECQDSFSFLRTIKSLYAEDPEHQLNIYITCHPDSPNGTLAGISYYPWSSSPIGYLGGFWVNVASGVGAGNFVATHELGHNLGLYHTFRGVAEIDSCGDPCVENVMAPDNDVRGDFAADTPPTPVNPVCGPPPGLDCLGSAWGTTQPENLMGYGPPGCQTLFTPDQIHRIQCWTRQVLAGWLSSPPAACERQPDTATTGLWQCNDGAGALAADALGGPAAELVGGAGWGRSGCGSTAIVLQDPGDGLRLPGSALGRLPAGTIECTFQWDGTAPGADGAWLFDQSSGPGASNLGVVLAPDSTLRLHIRGAERVASNTVIEPLRWYRLAANWDGAVARLALDDVHDAEAAAAVAPDSLGEFLWFGRSGGAVPGGAFAGSLDEIRISRIARPLSRPPAPIAPQLRLVVAPNPAAGSTVVSFSLLRPGRARLEVFDLAGRRIATLYEGELPAGSHTRRWNGGAASGTVRGGVYVVRLTAGDATVRRTVAWTP